MQRILEAAAAAPDHRQLLPWRFVLVSDNARARLGATCEQALVDRDRSPTAEQRAQARDKAVRAPLLMLAVARLEGRTAGDVPDAERLVSLGCALQNMMLVATEMGYATALTSGQAMQSRPLRELFSLAAGEQAVCFLNVGTVSGQRPAKARPTPERYVSELG